MHRKWDGKRGTTPKTETEREREREREGCTLPLLITVAMNIMKVLPLFSFRLAKICNWAFDYCHSKCITFLCHVQAHIHTPYFHLALRTCTREPHAFISETSSISTVFAKFCVPLLSTWNLPQVPWKIWAFTEDFTLPTSHFVCYRKLASNTLASRNDSMFS